MLRIPCYVPRLGVQGFILTGALDLVDLFLFAAVGNVVTLSIASLLQKSSYDKDRGVTEDVAAVNAADVAKMRNSKFVVQK